MFKLLSKVLFVLFFLKLSAQAQVGSVQSTFSPKLQQFLIAHPGTSELITNVLSEAFSNKTVTLYYFYTNDKSTAPSFHYYPGTMSVGIVLKENQQPIDQFITFIFEAINSEGEENFKDIDRRAERGFLSKEDYVFETLNQEFGAMQKTHKLVQNLRFSNEEISESDQFRELLNCPDNFQDFLTYLRKQLALKSENNNAFKTYEAAYDSLINSQAANPDKQTK